MNPMLILIGKDFNEKFLLPHYFFIFFAATAVQ